MRSTFREVILVVTICCVLLGAMMKGGFLTSIELLANAILAIIFCCLIICSLVMTGQRRAFSIGFVVPALLYGLTLMIAGKGEFDVNAEPKHRASIILRIAYKKISRDLVIDMETGKEIENYASLTIHERLKKETIFMKVPSPQNFMYFGHMLILMFLGYCGAQFGRWAFWYDSCRRRVAV